MDIVFVVYDCGVQESFEYAVMWLELLAFTGFSKTVVLVGNKWEKTLIGGAVVTQEQGLNTAKNFSTFFTEGVFARGLVVVWFGFAHTHTRTLFRSEF